MSKLDQFHQYHNEDDIQIDDPTRRIYMRVMDVINLMMDDNPKIHDLGAIATSIMRYGFQDPPKYDSTLGAIKAGNGRSFVLSVLEEDGRFPPPPGIGLDGDGAWVMPVLIGVDSDDADEALAYSVDANTLNLSGSGMSPIDAAMMFDPEMYQTLIKGLAEQGKTPVSIGEEAVELLFEVLEKMTETWENYEDGTPDFSNLTRCPACGHYWKDEDEEEEEADSPEDEHPPTDHLPPNVSPF